MKVRLKHLVIPEDMPVRLAGLDLPGDASVSILAVARWLAFLRGSISVELSDFLTSVHLIFGRSISKYWPSSKGCRQYLRRNVLPNSPRETLLREALRWLFAGTVYGHKRISFNGMQRTALVSGRDVRGSQAMSSTVSVAVTRLMADAARLAVVAGRTISTQRSGNIGVPNVEAVLLCLLDKNDYDESKRLRDSGFDGDSARNAIFTKK